MPPDSRSDASTPTPPVAPTRPTTTSHHGRTRVDEYDWLREKDSEEVLDYLKAENAYTEARTAHLADLRQQVFDEIKSRTLETDLSVPTRSRGYWYYGRSFEGEEYGVSCRVPVVDPDDWTPPEPAEVSPDRPALPGEEVLLDHNRLAEGHDFYSVGGTSVSPSTTLLAYSVDVVGDERYTIRVRDLASGELLDDEITGVLGGAVWDRDSSSFYYLTVDDAWRPYKVWRHRLGTAQADDELVFHEADARYWVGIGRTRTDRFLMIASASWTTTEYHYLDAEAPERGWQLYCERRDDLEYSLDHAMIAGEDRFILTHNHTGPDFEVALSPIAPTPPEEWEPLIPYDPSVRIEDVDAHTGHLVVHQRSQGLTQLRILELDPAEGVVDDYLVEFGDELYTIGGGSAPEFDQPVVRVGYTTMSMPPSIYDYDVRTRELQLRKRAPVLGGYDPEEYAEYRLWAKAEDGERIPISLVVRKDAEPNRPVPLLLYGYGSYEQSVDPFFSIARISLLDRGAAFAVAHVRGGGEMGRRWYEDGKLLKKRNTFTDFVACAQHLAETGWTTPELTVAEGGSAGGLLMGAVANLAPEQFGGIVASVPFVDNLTSMLDASLPLTVLEYEEWGNPEADPEVYDYLASYAPYDNVADLPYPPILAETSLHDTRVLYVEPAKWVARLRATTEHRDVLLRTEMSAGHGGVSGRYQSWHDRAFSLAWILDRMDLARSA